MAQCSGWHTAADLEQTGIPQGSVLSPWLCNVYLWRLDDAMQTAGAANVRFADDFVLLSFSRRRAEDPTFCAEVVRQLRLRLHPLKTSIIEATAPFRFLGGL